MKRITLIISILLFLFINTNAQSNNYLNPYRNISKDSISFIQIKTDSLYNSKQIISFLILPTDAFKKFRIDIGYSKSDLFTTGSFGKKYNSKAAVNGSYFDMDSGGSVTYFEINDSIISRNRQADLKWAKPDSLINGAVVITKDFQIIIQRAKSEHFYEISKEEHAVLISGPLLLLNSEKVKLPDMDFANKRHPRTCLCLTGESLVFIVIDGRQKEAEGMSLTEVQGFLLNIGCTDAINLDGGGSTTMWIRDKGVVNFVSGESGERPVSNVFLILEK
jgi:exopolysaccharide biosynthesis protein